MRGKKGILLWNLKVQSGAIGVPVMRAGRQLVKMVKTDRLNLRC